jgi:cholest-4-en-3-one 26-monooxygenase
MGEQLNSADLDSIDIHSIERYLARGYPWAEWDLLRRDAPVYWYDRPGIEPFWAITRYEDVHAVGRAGDTFINSGPRLRLASIDHDRKLWASKSRRDSLYDWDPAEPIDMVFMDDPRHLVPPHRRPHGRDGGPLRRGVRGSARRGWSGRPG